MKVTRTLWQAAAQHRTPMIHFIGKRSIPKTIDHTPQTHPASPAGTLPDSFKAYRSKAQQHGPLNNQSSYKGVGGQIGGHSGESLGPVEAPAGQFFDRSELPARFQRTIWSETEIEAIDTAGASLVA
ncbi:MAG: hypothetical protein M1824_006478 [Vezdaea acicularis]|nr:MAG: hypothetical protein M1824_006478 [Vezdaea acicularis]